MFNLTIKQNNEETVLEFETAELAKLYRDYHLVFGHWNSTSKWLEESKVFPDMMKFVIDEMTEHRDGKIVRFYKVTDGIELKIEKAISSNAVKEAWELIRKTRDWLLKSTDWTQIADNSLSQDERKEFRYYRQYLRTFPTLHNDESISMAKVYNFDEWKEGRR